MLLFNMWTSGIVKGANQSQLFFKVKRCRWQLSSKVKEPNTISLFASTEGSVPSIWLSTCSVWIKWARAARRKDRARATWLRLLKWAWETAKRDRATKAGQQKTPWMGCVRCVCVFRGSGGQEMSAFFLPSAHLHLHNFLSPQLKKEGGRCWHKNPNWWGNNGGVKGRFLGPKFSKMVV